MLKLGEKIINQIYLGDKKIAKVFWGEKLVYQASKPIFLDYVIFDGNSWIDTGLYANQNTEIRTTFNSSSTGVALYGVRDGNNNCTSYLSGNGAWRFGETYIEVDLRIDTTYNSIQNKEGVSLNGVFKAYKNTVQEFTSTKTILLGKQNNATFIPFKGKMYIFQVYNNGNLVQDLRPCIDAQGVVCFYDMVTRKYFYNSGTGTLKPSGRFVTSILFDGASFIDTGISHQTCRIETTIRFEETGTRQLMGFGSGSGQYWGKAANQTTFEYFSGTNAMDKTDVVLEYMCDDPTAPYLITHADGKTRVGTKGTKLSSLPYIIGGLLSHSTATTTNYSFTGEVWGQKTTINGVLVQDLRPYVDENNVACFKDVVTGNLFYNKGTGTLGYTEE